MIDPTLFSLFLPAALLLAVTPGADMMYCVGETLRKDKLSGYRAAIGLAAGAFSGVLIAGFGLSTLTAQHPGSLNLIRWIGIIYLFWLVLKTLTADQTSASTPSVSRGIGGGFLISLTNPKGAIFVLALLPQFISPDLPTRPQFLILGSTLTAMGFAANLIAASLAQRIAVTRRARKMRSYLTATIYGALAIRLTYESR